MSDDIACGVSDTSSLIVASWAVWYRDGRPRIADSATGFSGNVAQYQQSEPNAGSLDTTEKSLQRAQCDTCGGGGARNGDEVGSGDAARGDGGRGGDRVGEELGCARRGLRRGAPCR